MNLPSVATTIRSPISLTTYLEWFLLGLIALNTLLTAAVYPEPGFSLLAVGGIVGFGLLGWRGPLPRQLNGKIWLTGLEFGLILLPNIIDYRIPIVSLLGLIVILRSSQRFRLAGRLIVTGITIALFFYAIFWRGVSVWMQCQRLGPAQPKVSELITNPLNYQLSSALSFGLTIIFAFPLLYALLAERKSRLQLALAHKRLRRYARLAEDQASLQERNRIAREIHDALGHTLTAQSIQLENAQLFLLQDPARAAIFLQQAQTLLLRSIAEVRQSVKSLHTDPLRGKSLEVEIQNLLEEFELTMGVLPIQQIQLPETLNTEVGIVLYRILQEALTNICKHSHATEVRVELREIDQAILLQIQDNGKGFDLQQNTSGFGVRGMQERVTAIGGQITLNSQPEAGCLLRVTIPRVQSL
jgi:signal transduction histidine kinase